ncbi:MAG: carbohydrate ABC transporter permease [Aggregatilineales bacterium]
MPNRTLTPRDWAFRVLAYILMSAFGIFMLFPFFYMALSSLKTSNDIFHYPPRLLPYTPESVVEEDGSLTAIVDGEETVLDVGTDPLPLYEFEIDGQVRQLILTDENSPRYGFFTSADLMNVESARDSEIVAEVALDASLEDGSLVDLGEQVVLQDSNGADEEFDLYEVTIDGETQELLLAYRGVLDLFVDPNNPAISIYAVERTAQQVEYVDFQFENYETVFDLNLDRALVNTTLVTIGVVVGQLITSIFGGYAFSRIKFVGRDTLFLLYLGSFMIPFVVLIIPMYRLMVVIGWENRIVSLIVPWIFTVYGTFLMRQFFTSIPKEIEEAALLDGASRFRILWGIFVPLSKPAIATLTIFSFLYAWNSFLWPLLIIGEGNETNHVLTLSLIRLSNIAADRPNLVLTGAAVAIVPPIIIFILAQKYFIEGVSTSGLKG